MREFLHTYYGIQMIEEIVIEGKLGYQDKEYVYFTISADNNKAIHMEQATLSYYLVETGYNQTAFPIPNLSGEWVTNVDQKNFIVVKVHQIQQDTMFSHGELLANFHQKNMAYQYEPQYVSSYGEWKQLWINKLTFFEQYIAEKADKNPNSFYRLLIDVLPYIIGISENAIQYIQESEFDRRYDGSDQGTICFYRYDDHLLKSIIWPSDLVYDHLTRDIAEYMRKNLLTKNSIDNVLRFLNDYESVHPLSIFSWRLLYARLIFPIHLFDFIIDVLESETFAENIEELEKLLERQVNFQKNLKDLFDHIQIAKDQVKIPLLHWL